MCTYRGISVVAAEGKFSPHDGLAGCRCRYRLLIFMISPIMTVSSGEPGVVYVKASLFDGEVLRPFRENFPEKKPSWLPQVSLDSQRL